MRTVNPEQHAQKRSAILQAAAVEFASGGVDGTSTAAICRRAGIGSGTLFHYFRTKRAIFHALFADDLQGNAEVCEQALADDDALAGLDRLVAQLIGDLADPLVPGLAAAAFLEASRDAEFAQLLAADEERVLGTLTILIERMDGPVVFVPPRAARWIVSLIDATFLTVADAADFDAKAQAAELGQLIDWLVGRATRRPTQGGYPRR